MSIDNGGSGGTMSENPRDGGAAWPDEASVAAIYNYRRLSDRLITGGQPTEAQLAALSAAGCEVVINLAPHEGERSLPDERRVVEGLGMAYEHIPVPWERPTLAHLEAFFAAMDRHDDRRLCLHCIANMRVSAFVFLHRMLRLGWRIEDALPDLRALWRPSPPWQAFIDEALGR